MRRVSVVGIPGSGKSTIAEELAALLEVPVLELDALYHQPNWAKLPDEEFVRRTAELARTDGWVIDGNYSAVRERLVWPGADTVVWLDLPRRVVMTRLVRRTVRRTVTRQELWNGNRERASNLTSWDPHRSILRWAWTRFRPYRERYETAIDDPQWGHLRFVRLRTSREVARFTEQLATASGR